MVSLPDHLIVVGVRSDPEPQIAAFHLHGQSPVTASNPCRPKATDLLEMQGRMLWILLEQFVVLVGERSDVGGQPPVGFPECLACEVPHRSRARPLRKSASACSARRS